MHDTPPPGFAARLGRQQRAELIARGRPRHFRRGEVIFREGDPGDSLLLIQTGVVELSVLRPNGGRVVLTHLTAGGIVGEMALLDSGPRSATVSAQTEVTGATVARDRFLGFLRDSPELHLALTADLSAKLRAANRVLEELTGRDGASRLARGLLRLARATGGAEADGRLTIRLRLSQSELGEIVGLTRANVNRLLRAWTDEGLILSTEAGLAILRPDALEDRAVAGERSAD